DSDVRAIASVTRPASARATRAVSNPLIDTVTVSPASAGSNANVPVASVTVADTTTVPFSSWTVAPGTADPVWSTTTLRGVGAPAAGARETIIAAARSAALIAIGAHARRVNAGWRSRAIPNCRGA